MIVYFVFAAVLLAVVVVIVIDIFLYVRYTSLFTLRLSFSLHSLQFISIANLAGMWNSSVSFLCPSLALYFKKIYKLYSFALFLILEKSYRIQSERETWAIFWKDKFKTIEKQTDNSSVFFLFLFLSLLIAFGLYVYSADIQSVQNAKTESETESIKRQTNNNWKFQFITVNYLILFVLYFTSFVH